MGLADLLSTPFLISLGITFLLVGILGIFLSQKIMDQNHKISSMLGLVTTMAEELNFIRARFQMTNNNNFAQGTVQVQRTFENQVPEEEPLIEVSDEEESDDSEEVSDDSEEESDEDEDEDEEKLIIGEESQDVSTIKVIQMGETMTFKEQEQTQDLEELEEVEESTFVTEDDNVSFAEESVSASEETVSEETASEETASEETVTKKNVTGTDLKKMTIQNLRDIAVKKGFSGDVSKMKKADVLKIVEGLL